MLVEDGRLQAVSLGSQHFETNTGCSEGLVSK